ncbi:helix-turn-helix domain-containing protein [Streptomyces sp. NPDC058067]|uniref:helix-turn-helix transcriptional regulator n=1 Tax=Streptomyces sp. NPDC058067 TaxID=3346324 RepID=UPI0036EBEDE2
MTTATRPLPPHGTTARAYGSPGYREACKCSPCRHASNRHNKKLRVNRELGRSPFTSPVNAQAHLRQIHQAMSWPQIVDATGIPVSNLIRIYNGGRTKIRHETEAKILVVEAPEHGGPGQCIDATGTMRRVQALSYVGHSYSTIAKAANTSRNRILNIANGRQATVRRAVAQRLAAAYQQLAFAPPRSNRHTARTRNEARAKGWHGPLAWDDIEDPNAQPEVDEHADKRGRPATVDAAEVARLTRAGLTTAQIARQLDCHVRTVTRARGRITTNDLKEAA